jgi:mRNA-degrading endonuclease RelE of RelBE toxin-antitoxin system
MEFRIADTFTDSLTRLTNDEQKAVKTTAFDLQLNPAHPSLQFHKLDKPKDKRFSSIRVSSDIRVIVHRTDSSMLLCYVGHHDDAYSWAERRKLETHPKTGAAQFVEIRETVQEIFTPVYIDVPQPIAPKRRLFETIADETLLSYGVPSDWLADIRKATEDTLLKIIDHIPSEAAEALLDLATGITPPLPKPVPVGADPFQHPDAQRRFRVMTNIEELERALNSPWEKWTVFLHPVQRALVERDYNGPARVSGSAGTGKTIVALHRAAHLARTNPESRILLTTFSDPLANALRGKLHVLIGNEPRLAERIDVYSMGAIGRRLYEKNIGTAKIASNETIAALIAESAAAQEGNRFSQRFLQTEWEQVVDAWQLASWEAYRDVTRLGRKTRLQEKQRAALWSIFERVRNQGILTPSALFTQLAARLNETEHHPFDFIVVDEAQDISIAQLRFLSALTATHPNTLFFAGDLGQRIFQQPFSWKSLGVDIRGRSFTLRINYRTSHQIRSQADRLLGPELSDVDGNTEKRGGTVSTFNGPPPEIQILDNEQTEIQSIAQWLVKQNSIPPEIGVFVRSSAQLDRARQALTQAKIPFKVLDENYETTPGHAYISTMHLAKGLEFRTVVVMACDDEVIPLQERIQTVGDDADLEEVYATERQLLYVACTRARDHLLVTGVKPASEFLDDLRGA